MAILGSIVILLAFAAAILTAFCGMAAGKYRVRRYAELSEQGVYLIAGLLGIASAILLYSFLTNDFAIEYVAGRSDRRMPLWYLMSAFWGGQQGSWLYWSLVSSVLGAAATWSNRHKNPQLMPYFHGVLATVLTGLLLILVMKSNPFETFAIIDAPAEGEGLNPLLQTPLMTIHPQCLLSGFAAMAVPFSFGMAAMLAGDTSPEWLRATRKWMLIAWLFLTCGNILGGMWAYRELGWGGYWAWDKVENFALIPWFTATAFLHSAIIQENRGMMKRWNVVLVSLTFLLTLFGTYMTRAGFIDSVHTFAQSEIGNWFAGVLIFFVIFTVVVVATRWKNLESERNIENPISREGAFLLNNWMLLALAFIVLWGSVFPEIKGLITGRDVTIGPPWFNKITAPVGLALLALIPIGTLLPWRRVTWRNLRRNFTIPLVATAVLTPTVIVLYWQLRGNQLGVQPYGYAKALAFICLALVVFNAVTLFLEFWRGTRARMRSAGVGPFAAITRIIGKHRRRYGGYIIHIGVVCIFLAFLGNAVKAEDMPSLQLGDTFEVADYTMRFADFETTIHRDYIAHTADIELYRDGEFVGTLTPSRHDYNDYSTLQGQPDTMKITSEIYIRSTPIEDVYVAMLSFRETEGVVIASFQMEVYPFTWWFWFGGVIMVIGTLICLWPEDDIEFVNTGAGWRRAAEWGFIITIALVPVPVFMSQMQAFAQEGGSVGPVVESPDGNHDPAGEHTNEHSGTADGAADEDEHTANPGHGELGHVHGADEPAHLEASYVLTQDQGRVVHAALDRVMTTCSGCAGKTLSLASPSCYPSNLDRARIETMVAAGMDLNEVLEVFVEERGPSAVAIPIEGADRSLAVAVPVAGGLFGFGLIAFVVRRKRDDDDGDLGDSDAAIATTAGDGTPTSDNPDDGYLQRFRDELAELN